MLDSSEPRPRTALAKLLRRAAGTGGMLALLAAGPGWAQMPGGAPPAVGVIAAKRQPITQSAEYTGRIQATNRVNLVARVSAYLDEVLFKEGAEVKKGDLLYRLEQAPFPPDLQAKHPAAPPFTPQLLHPHPPPAPPQS